MKNKSLHRVMITLLTLGLVFAVGVFGDVAVSVAASCPANGCRTDRNNNPAAITYDFANNLTQIGYR